MNVVICLVLGPKTKKNSCASPLDNFAYLGDLEKEMMPKMLRVAVPGAGDVLSGGDPAHRVNM